MATDNHTQEPGSTPENTITPYPISDDTLRRYIKSREKIDKDIDLIIAFTNLLSQYKDCSGDELLIDIYSIGYINQMMHGRALDLIEELEGFISLGEAMGAVMEDVAGDT